MTSILHRLRGLGIAAVALALSAGLAFAAEPPEAASWGLANAANHAGKTVPVQAGDDEAAGEEEETGDETGEEEEAGEEEETSEDEESVEAADNENCATDPTALTDEELAEMRHGSIVCWAAHQTEWPEEFANHGAWVKSWAQWDKDDEEGEEDEAEGDLQTDASGSTKANGKGKGNGNGKGKSGRD